MSNLKTTKSKKGNKTITAPFSFKRHIIPPIIGVFVMIACFGLINAQLIAAQYSYRKQISSVSNKTPVVSSINKDNEVIISEDASIINIPSLGISAPIINEASTDEWAVQKALENGVVHYGNTGEFGSIGNAVLFGHSSGSPWAPGNHKFVFTLLEKIQNNSEIVIDYHGNRYIYKVKSTEIIAPTELNVLSQPSDKMKLTLITCSPIGSNKKRFVVYAEQIKPTINEQLGKAQISPINDTSVNIETSTLPSSAEKPIWMVLFDMF